MNLIVLNVLRKGSAAYSGGQQMLFPIGRLSNAVPGETNQTRITYTPNSCWAANTETLVVEGDYISIQNSISGYTDDSATIIVTPNKINGVTNTQQKTIRISDIGLGAVNATSASNIDLFVTQSGRCDPARWTFNSTTLEAKMAEWNEDTQSLNVFGLVATFGSCGTSTQAATITNGVAITAILQVFNGSVWVDVDTKSVSAGTANAVTFSFSPGDIVSGDPIQIVASYGGQFYPIAQYTFQCTGGTGSGSGISGDCNMYAYFDGEQWSNETDTLNWGASCSQGYHLQIATDNLFTDVIVDITTTATIVPFEELANGTYYARVQNVAGYTRYSPTLTFTKS